jgi:hypothetical protein
MRVIRRLQHPAATVAAVVVLLMSVASIPKAMENPRSVVGGWIWSGLRMHGSPSIEYWHLLLHDGRWSFLADPSDSADALTEALANGPAQVVSVRRHRGIEGRGFYDPMFQTRFDSINASTAAGTPVEIARMRSLAEALKTFEGFEPFDADAAEYKTGWASVRVTTTRWSAVVHNIGAAAALVILPISLGWIPRMIREQREAKRKAAGLCLGCGYDRQATPSDAPCPECGRSPNEFC